MRCRVLTLVIAGIGTGTIALSACHDVETSPNAVASVSLDSLPYPSVVAGDTLRDSLGVARPMHGNAYNVQGDSIAGFPVRYRALDPGVQIDTVTGFIVGDTARSTPVRVLLDARGLQTPVINLYVVPRPDTVAGTNALDSLTYTFTSTTQLSNTLTVTVSKKGTTLTPVRAYLVSFAIEAPGTTFAQLVDDGGTLASVVDTTDVNGVAGRRLKITPANLSAANDSVVVFATVRDKGVLIAGSPVRLVLRVKAPVP